MALSAARNLNPIVLIAGTLAVPIATAAIGRSLFTVDPKAKDPEAEIRSLVTKFALLNAAVAGGLGYATSRSKNDAWRSAALGGAVGTALVASLLGSTALLTPKQEPTAAVAGHLPGHSRVTNGWVSNLVGVAA